MNRILMATAILCMAGQPSCFATPFDLIVPSEVKVRSNLGTSGVGAPWGWIVATSETLSFAELQNHSFSLSTDSSEVTVSTTFHPGTSWTPMQPGDIAGLDVLPFTAPLQALQQNGEVVNPFSSNFWRWDISYTPGFVGEVNLHTMMEISGTVAEFDTLLRLSPSFGSETEVIEIVTAQRIVAIPEPSSLGMLLVLLLVSTATVRQIG